MNYMKSLEINRAITRLPRSIHALGETASVLDVLMLVAVSSLRSRRQQQAINRVSRPQGKRPMGAHKSSCSQLVIS